MLYSSTAQGLNAQLQGPLPTKRNLPAVSWPLAAWPLQVGPLQVGYTQVGLIQVGPVQLCPMQVGLALEGSCHSSLSIAQN
jgi:hypothetical protein